jgi:poly-beta-1,6-N-acetyl-D-glucosamine synthase
MVTQILFWAAAGLVVYTYAGYPLAVYLLARLWSRPVAVDERYQPTVCMVVVVYNEQARIRAKIANALQLDYPADRFQMLVVSDGSTDGTHDVVRSFGDPTVRLLEFNERRGKAACVNDGIAVANADIVLLTDARQRIDRFAANALVRHFADPEVAAVSGELCFEDLSPTGFSKGIDFYWRYEKFVRSREAQFDSVIGVTGAIYALKRSAFEPIPAGTILDDVLIPMQMAMKGSRITFEPEARAFDEPAREAQVERRRKVRTLAGNWQVLGLCPALLNPLSNRLWWQYLSHKVLRLVAPLFLLAAFVLNLALLNAAPLYIVLFVLQIAFYGCALVGQFSPAFQRIAPVRWSVAFLQLNGFAVLGYLEHRRNSSAHLWR